MTEATTVQIVSRWNDVKVLFETEIDASISLSGRIKSAVQIAVKRDAYLRGANLRGSDLRGANLRGADLRGADLCGSDLSCANLRGSDLRGSDLHGSDLSNANLCGADLSCSDLSDANLCVSDLRGSDLRGSDLRGSNLCGSDLRGADLSGADLRGADLRDADLRGVKQDFLAEVMRMPDELEALRFALIEGKVDGSSYSGTCACLAGTLAKARGVSVNSGDLIGHDNTAFQVDARSPREVFFAAIKAGDTPETNAASAVALAWTDEAIAIRDMIRATGGAV